MSDTENPYASPTADLYAAPADAAPFVDAAALRMTALGLSLIYYGCISIMLFLIVSIFTFSFGFGLGFGPGPRFGNPPMLGIMGSIFMAVFGLIGLAVLAGYLMMLIGPFFCLTAAKDSGGRALLIVSIVLQWIWLAANIFRYGQSDGAIVGILIACAGLASSVSFLLFLKNLADYIARFDLARRVNNVLYVGGFSLVGCIAIAAVIALGGREVAVITLGTLVLLIAALILFVMYMNLINSLRKALVQPRKKKRSTRNVPD